MTAILTSSDAHIARAGQALRAGAPVVMPTETVYGLAADATNADAVAAVFAAKARPADDPLIVHVSPALVGDDALGGLQRTGIVGEVTADQQATARALMDTAWPGPMTLVLPRGDAVPESVSSRLPTVAVRMPAHPVARAVIDAAGTPLVAPSANRFGRISPTTAAAAFDELDGRVDWIVDGGRCDVGVESSVLRVDADGGVGILRPGAVGPAAILAATDRTPYVVDQAAGIAGSPGRTLRHYAPGTPLAVVHEPPEAWSDARWDDLVARARRVVWIGWSDAEGATAVGRRLDAVVLPRVLTPSGDTAEAAHHLYAALRRADDEGADLIVLEVHPTGPLATALLDRVTRAAHGTPPLAE